MTKSTVTHGTTYNTKAADKLAELLITSMDHEAFDPRAIGDADGDQNPVSFADNPNYNRNSYILFGQLVAKCEKTTSNTGRYIMQLEQKIEDEKSRNPVAPDTEMLEKRLQKAHADQANSALLAHAFEIFFEVCVDRTWTNPDDFQSTINHLFGGTATSTQSRIQPTKDSALARMKARKSA